MTPELAPLAPTLIPTLAAWLHDLDPIAFRLGPATIYWYGISYILGFALAWVLLVPAARRGLTPIPAAMIGDVVLFGGIGGVIGGRLGYLLIYSPDLLTEFTGSFPFWQALNIARGGMASHGGMVGALLGLMLLGRVLRKRAAHEDLPQLARVRGGLPTKHVVDLACFAAPIGLMCGRLANFVNGELLGKIVAGPVQVGEDGPVDDAPWWAVRFPQEIMERYAAGEISGQQMVRAAEAVGMSQLEMLAPEGEERFVLAYHQLSEALRAGSQEAANAMPTFLNARHPSQLYQAAVEGPLLLLALAIVWARPRVAGVVTAWFMILYGLGRIATEFYRLPDADFANPRPLGFSRGQWLSVGLVVGGAGLLAWVVVRAKRRRARGELLPRFGGWLAPALPAPLSTQPRDPDGGGASEGDKPQ